MGWKRMTWKERVAVLAAAPFLLPWVFVGYFGDDVRWWLLKRGWLS